MNVALPFTRKTRKGRKARKKIKASRLSHQKLGAVMCIHADNLASRGLKENWRYSFFRAIHIELAVLIIFVRTPTFERFEEAFYGRLKVFFHNS